MTAGEAVIYRAQHNAPWRRHGVFVMPLAVALICLFGPGTSSGLVFALAAALVVLLCAIWIFFYGLSIQVTGRDLRLQRGLLEPSIPLERIDTCRIVPYRPGSRVHEGERVYDVTGDTTEALEVGYRDAGGERVQLLIATRDARRVGSAIEQGRSRLPSR